MTNSKNESFGFAYDFASRITSMSRPNLVSTQFVYDANSFLTQINHRKSGNTISYSHYTRDPISNRTQMVTSHGTHQYQYDNEGQLISASHPEADALHNLETFNYDSLGNRTSDNQGSYTYDNKKHRLEEDWKHIYVYDLNGNLISRQEKQFAGKVQNFVYSSENQLVSIEWFENNSSVKKVEYSYDALGRRVVKKVRNGTGAVTLLRKYVYDGQEVIAELDEDDNTLVRYTHSGMRTDDVLSMDVTTMGVNRGLAPAVGSYFFHKDGLGSIIEITNSSGNIIQHYVYSSFGKILKIVNGSVDNTQNPLIKTNFAYTNREYDSESGLYYYRARYYDTSIGRFLSEDPDPGKLTNPIGHINKYIYVYNNSANLTDPKGKFPWLLFAIGAAIGFGTSLDSGSKSLDENGKPRGFSSQVIWGAVLSGLWGGLQGSLGGLTGWSALLAIPAGTLLSTANNMSNQLIFKGKVDDWNSVGKAAGGGAIWGTLGAGLAGANYVFFEKAIIGYGILVSIPATQNTESGIPDNKINCAAEPQRYECRL